MVEDALVQDRDVPLSLMQKSASAIKADATHLKFRSDHTHSSQRRSSQHLKIRAKKKKQQKIYFPVQTKGSADTAIPKFPPELIDAAANKDTVVPKFPKQPVDESISQSDPASDSWNGGSHTTRAFFAAVSVLSVVLVVHIFFKCVELETHKAKNPQDAPKISLPVDHLVAATKLDWAKQKAKLYEQVKQSGNILASGRCTPRTYSRNSDSRIPEGKWDVDSKGQSTSQALDPKLVLPLRETWYAVALEKVLKTDGSFEIMRITGSPSLSATVYHGSESGGTLEIFSSSGSGKRPLAHASCLNIGGSMPVIDVKDSANDGNLGQLRGLFSDRSFELVRNDEVVMSLNVDDDGQLQLVNGNSEGIACVSCLAGHLGICVNAGADTGLIITLVLSAVLLGGAWEHVLSKTAKRGNVKMHADDQADDADDEGAGDDTT